MPFVPGSPDNDDEGPRYPFAPGFRNTDTSKEAADSVAEHTARMSWLILSSLKDEDMTCDEIAEAHGLERFCIRPRTAELRKLGIIKDSGKRRPNPSSGRRAIVWTFVPEDQRPVDGQAEATRPTETQAA